MILRKMFRVAIFYMSIGSWGMAGQFWLDIDLSNQKAYLVENGSIVDRTPISSGDATHPTPTGIFSILEKELNHFSTLYGRVVSASGRVIRGDACGFDPLAAGEHFVAARMPYFMRFDNCNGLHAGSVPSFPASHGCIRLPPKKAQLYFEKLEIGDKVLIHGSPPNKYPGFTGNASVTLQ
jgi:lipoprotein-anchoring transpeptidase ErfK/SrfK